LKHHFQPGTFIDNTGGFFHYETLFTSSFRKNLIISEAITITSGHAIFFKAMKHSTTKTHSHLLQVALPWLYFFGALLAFTLITLFTVIHSELGREISVGENPGFAWVRENITTCLWILPGYLAWVFWLQYWESRRLSGRSLQIITGLVGVELLSIGMIGVSFLFAWNDIQFLMQAVLVTSLLLLSVLSFGRHEAPGSEFGLALLQKPERNTGVYLTILFFCGAAITLMDPSSSRMSEHMAVNAQVDEVLIYFFRAMFSGITSLWFGIGMWVILMGCSTLLLKRDLIETYTKRSLIIPFSVLAAFYASILLVALSQAIPWELSKLNLKPAMIQLLILFSGGAGILISCTYWRIITRVPQAQKASTIGLVAFSLGAALFYPLTWLLTSKRMVKWSWPFIFTATVAGSVFVGYLILYGDIFNPWFTVFSYLKGAILKTLTIAVAGAGLLIFEQTFSLISRSSPHVRRLGIGLAIIVLFSFFPFSALEKYPELKVTLLQFNELARVDAAYARELGNLLGLNRWIRIGQNPDYNNSPHPWPQPWTLKKTHQSRLPDNFNLLIIVVDALRGDAFRSAGYRRNITPFLDRWTREETVSFHRAYSQGGGSFAAFPFLVGGRTRLTLYGPELFRENLYFKIAQAEGIKTFMLMKGFGPRHIYPPDLPVVELATPRAVSDRRSATADEVFDSAQKALSDLSKGERFLCFLQLMDVHNDLWKKADGIDFGDSPRDLYDNNLSYIDRAFSRFLSWLEQADLYDKTVILFTSDHGEQFWEHGASLHGHTLYEEEIRIPLILLARGIRGRFENVPVIAADMAPTIADLAGYSVDPPYSDPHMGISLVPLILNNKRERYLNRDVVGRASFKRRYLFYRNWEWKLVYFAELDLLQLFNVIQDPFEKNNLLQEEVDLAAELEKALFDYLEKVEGKTYRTLLSKRKQ
jgi:arylsulfatase A-like enzyme